MYKKISKFQIVFKPRVLTLVNLESVKKLNFSPMRILLKFLKYFEGETMYKKISKFQIVLNPKVVPLVI